MNQNEAGNDTYSTTSKLKAFHLLKSHFRIFCSFIPVIHSEELIVTNDFDILDESIALGPPGHGIPVEVYKFEFAERFEHLLDIGLGEVKVQGTNV